MKRVSGNKASVTCFNIAFPLISCKPGFRNLKSVVCYTICLPNYLSHIVLVIR